MLQPAHHPHPLIHNIRPLTHPLLSTVTENICRTKTTSTEGSLKGLPSSTVVTFAIWGFFLTLLSKATYYRSFTHSYTDGRVTHARRLPALQEQLGLRCPGQGHLTTQLGGAGDRTRDLPVSSPPTLPAEALPPDDLLIQPHQGS